MQKQSSMKNLKIVPISTELWQVEDGGQFGELLKLTNRKEREGEWEKACEMRFEGAQELLDVVGEDGGGIGAEAQGRSRLGHGALAQGMGDATAVLERDGLARQSHAGKGKEGEIVGEGHAGALSSACSHGTAETAVYRAVIGVFLYPQLGGERTEISEHGGYPSYGDLFAILPASR